MTVLQLSQALFWGVICTLPLCFMQRCGFLESQRKEGECALFFWLGVTLQAFACSACYIAGTVK